MLQLPDQAGAEALAVPDRQALNLDQLPFLALPFRLQQADVLPVDWRDSGAAKTVMDACHR
ncbi:hypothetical protein CEK28_02530 [Xenophilus sp. AP218F]|nr:hypothetical protein [Chromobacterium sp. ASV5]OWY40424.1 hypothetical protein CEK28_02530 [Xenophilus sp. AP218F]